MSIPKASSEMRDKLRKLLRNWDWLNSNLASIQANYGVKWIAIAEAKVVVAAQTVEEVKKQLEGKYPRPETLLVSVPEGEVSKSI